AVTRPIASVNSRFGSLLCPSPGLTQRTSSRRDAVIRIDESEFSPGILEFGSWRLGADIAEAGSAQLPTPNIQFPMRALGGWALLVGVWESMCFSVDQLPRPAGAPGAPC